MSKHLGIAFFSTVAFILGALASILCGYLGMKIATYANARTALEAQKSIGAAFIVAFESGAVMGFLLTTSGLLVLYITIVLFKLYFGDDWVGLYESITGYGLGGSSVALFGRVNGGIYTKATDVSADLLRKIKQGIPEDDSRNPAVIADNVGDNMGHIAGMGADLFGSFAESTCAAFVISSLSSFGTERSFVAMSYPLLISASGIFVCLITTLFATDFITIRSPKYVEILLKAQLTILTVLATSAIVIVSYLALLTDIVINIIGKEPLAAKWRSVGIAVISKLWASLIIGFITEYFTCNTYASVRKVADACKTGAALNIIFGLAIGYKLLITPVFAIAAAIYTSYVGDNICSFDPL